MDELGFISQWRAIFAGGLAGVVAALATYPLEVAETRLIIQNCRQPTYIGVAHLVKGLQERGAARPLQGIFPHCLGFVYTLLQTNSFLVDRVRFCI